MLPNKELFSKVVGTTFYEVPFDVLEPFCTLVWKRQPENPFDTNAIALFFQGEQIGHIPKETAADLAPMIDNGTIDLEVIVNEITGGDEKHQGINITLMVQYLTLDHLQAYNPFMSEAVNPYD